MVSGLIIGLLILIAVILISISNKLSDLNRTTNRLVDLFKLVNFGSMESGGGSYLHGIAENVHALRRKS